MILYKYSSADSALRILEGLRLKVALPNECNDPFEFTPWTKRTLTKKYLLEKARSEPEHFRGVFEQMKRDGLSGSFQDFINNLRGWAIERNWQKTYSLHRQALEENDLNWRKGASEFVGVVCLCATNKSIPMWAHYADKKCGVVIGIDAADECFRFGQFGRVKYRKRRVSVDPSAKPGTKLWWNQINRTIYTKSGEWAYEREYRIAFRLSDLVKGKLKDKRDGFFVDIWGSTVRSVIFGEFVSDENVQKIRKVLAAKPDTFFHVKQFRMTRHPKHFALRIQPFPT